MYRCTYAAEFASESAIFLVELYEGFSSGCRSGDISELLGKHGLAINNDGKIETCKGAKKKNATQKPSLPLADDP